MLSATLRLSATEVTTGVAVGFTAYASGGGLPYSYHWSFGDGQESSNEDPTHSYTRPGNYTVTLTVTDKDGNESTQTTSIRVMNSPIASGIFGIIRMGMIQTIALSIGVVWLLLVVLAVVLFVRTKRRPAGQLNSFQTQEKSENAPRST
jgi:PKD repeat protein